MLKVWGRRNSLNVQKVMWFLDEIDQPAKRVDAGMEFGGLDTPEYRALNPIGRIPVLEDNGRAIWESNSILRYLAAQYGGPGFWPEDAYERSKLDRWLDWQTGDFYPVMVPIFIQLIRTPEEKRDIDIVKTAIKELRSKVKILDDQLASNAFLSGKEFGLADIPLGCTIWRYSQLPIEREPLKHLDRWLTRLHDRPGFKTHVMLPLS